MMGWAESSGNTMSLCVMGGEEKRWRGSLLTRAGWRVNPRRMKRVHLVPKDAVQTVDGLR